jgi:UDP-glucose 4-epimerase
MRVLVTGSAGFVGREMVRTLQAQGHHVIGVDIRRETASNQFVERDLAAPGGVALPHFDVCVHLASQVGGILFNTGREDLVAANDAINATVSGLCCEAQCSRLVFFSSINVFEDSGGYRHEPLPSTGQTSPYALSKALGERLFEGSGLQLTVVRPTNIFGCSQVRLHSRFGESHVIPDLLAKIEGADAVEVFGDGSQMRNFVHVRDVCRFVECNLSGDGNRYFNLRSSITLTISQLVDLLAAHCGKTVEVTYRPEYMKLERSPIIEFDMGVPSRFGWSESVSSISEGLSC